jgi:hypothetical protein
MGALALQYNKARIDFEVELIKFITKLNKQLIDFTLSEILELFQKCKIQSDCRKLKYLKYVIVSKVKNLESILLAA